MKKIITLLLAILVILTFLTCNNNKQKQQIKKNKYDGMISPNLYNDLANDEKERTRLWKAAIDSGNCDAYDKIGRAYLMTYREVNLYYYSLIMANKYHCATAYFTMYVILTHEASPGDMVILSNDEDTKNLALYYLFKARELGSTQAKNSIDVNLSKSESLKNSSFFLKQMMKP